MRIIAAALIALSLVVGLVAPASALTTDKIFRAEPSQPALAQ